MTGFEICVIVNLGIIIINLVIINLNIIRK